MVCNTRNAVENRLLEILQETDEELKEIIFKQSSDGSKLSMVVGKNLFQVVRLDKKSRVKHEFSVTRSSVLGFKHHSFENISNWRLFLSVTCVISFIFISPISSTWTAPWYIADLVFIATLGMLIFSIGNPHILVFCTKSDRYSVLFFQWQSDRELVSKTLSDLGLAMSGFLVSGEFNMPKITYNIGRIGDTIATDSVVMEEVQTPVTENNNVKHIQVPTDDLVDSVNEEILVEDTNNLIGDIEQTNLETEKELPSESEVPLQIPPPPPLPSQSPVEPKESDYTVGSKESDYDDILSDLM